MAVRASYRARGRQAPSVRATSAPAPNSHCLRTLSCFSFGRGASDAGSRDTTRERWRSRGGLASPRISYARPFKQARADRQAARSCRAPAFDARRVGRLRAWPRWLGQRSSPQSLGRRGDGRGRRDRRRSGGHSGGNPYRGNGMWIWYVSRSSGGDLARDRRARRTGTGSRRSSSRAPTAATLEPVLARTRVQPPIPRPARLRLAVRLRNPPGAEASAGRRRSARAPTAW